MPRDFDPESTGKIRLEATIPSGRTVTIFRPYPADSKEFQRDIGVISEAFLRENKNRSLIAVTNGTPEDGSKYSRLKLGR